MIARNRIRAPRRGMSMAEVLVALFLLALGTIAILTMFPLGMYHMGQALKDDRTAQAANQADAFMRTYWRTNVVENPNVDNAAITSYPRGYEPMWRAFYNPDGKPDLFGAVTPIPIGNNPQLGPNSRPSYPVFVDPMGYVTPWTPLNPSEYQYWVGGMRIYPRRSLNLLLQLSSTPNMSQRVCSLLDGYGYDEDGIPTSGGAFAGFERDLRYNWMWILQKPDMNDPFTAAMTVVVFDKRAFRFAPAGSERVFSSGATAADTIWMQPFTTFIQVPVSRGIPPVQKGGWIMDATPGLRHAIFYRVVSVTDNTASTGMTDIELQSPIRRLDGGTGNYPGTLIFFAGVSEVFERPNLRANDY